MIKIIRITKGKGLLKIKNLMRPIKAIYQWKLNLLIKRDPKFADDIEVDNNKIATILMISYIMKCIVMVAILCMVSYFLGMFWYIFCDLTRVDDPVDVG